MKYSIHGYSQPALIKYKLDISEVTILRWFADFYLSNNMAKRTHPNGLEYSWVKYSGVIKDLPILNINNTVTIGRKFKSLCDKGILYQYIHKSSKGTYSCYRINGDIYKELTEFTKWEKETHFTEKSSAPLDSKVQPKDTTIKYTTLGDDFITPYPLKDNYKLFTLIKNMYCNKYYNLFCGKKATIEKKHLGMIKTICRRLKDDPDPTNTFKKKLNILERKYKSKKYSGFTLEICVAVWDELQPEFLNDIFKQDRG